MSDRHLLSLRSRLPRNSTVRRTEIADAVQSARGNYSQDQTHGKVGLFCRSANSFSLYCMLAKHRHFTQHKKVPNFCGRLRLPHRQPSERSCSPQKVCSISRGDLLQPIFVVQSAEHLLSSYPTIRRNSCLGCFGLGRRVVAGSGIPGPRLACGRPRL